MVMCMQRQLSRAALALLCATVPLRSAIALDPSKALTQYVHSSWRTADGLPQSSVMKVLETKDGYLWIGTQAGLARFDGVRFTVFDHSNTPALVDDWISDLTEDGEGTLWIGTSHGGVTTYRDGKFSHLDSVAARSALTLAVAVDGSVWLGGYGGMTHLEKGKVARTYTVADGLSGDPVTRVLADRSGSVWVATPGGLDQLIDGRIVAYTTRDGLPGNDVIDMGLDAKDTLWVKTQNAELTRWMDGHFQSWKIPGIAGADIHDILEDRDGNLWIASLTAGLFKISAQRVTHFSTKDGLSSNEIISLYEDRAGNIWVGTNEGGLDRFRNGSFTSYSRANGLAGDRTYSVMEDHAGDIWVTTPAGLNQLHGDRFRAFTTADGLPSNDVWALAEDHEQNLLIGTARNGLARMADGHVVPGLVARDGIPEYLLTAIVEDHQHALWIATRGGGLLRRADGQVTTYSRENGLLSNFIYALAEDDKGTLWIATSDGLNSITGGHIKSYADNPLLAHAWIITLHIDAKHVLWVGTVGRGLFRLEHGRSTRYTTRQGLLNDTVNSIQDDAAGNLWIGSDKGIYRLTAQELDAVAQGTGATMQPLVFGEADGMISSETNAGTQPTSWRARDGRLWFPTTRGLVVVDPARISLSDQARPATVEQLLADEVDTSLAVPARLAPGTRRLEIRYTAPNLSTPKRTRFRYRLDGFDEQWVAGSVQRVAQYTNLSPGHYTFHVGASDDSGRWGSREGILHFELLPQFYQTWWFHLLGGLAAMLALLGFYRLRVNWLHARAAVLEERQRIAGEIHDSLAQGLSGIVFQTEAALISMERAPAMTSKHLIAARDLAQSSLDDARYSVLNLSPPVLDQKSLLESLSAMARQLTGGRVDELDMHSSGTAWTVPAEAKHHIVLIAQEAVSNSMQHGNARTISINLTFALDSLRLAVTDDGIGFVPDCDAREHARGYGMGNMRHRALSLGARLEVTSEVGTGTRVFLNIPRPGLLIRWWQRLRGVGASRIEG